MPGVYHGTLEEGWESKCSCKLELLYCPVVLTDDNVWCMDLGQDEESASFI